MAGPMRAPGRRMVWTVNSAWSRGAPEGPRHGFELCLSMLKEPNDATREAIRELEQGKGMRSGLLEDLFRELGI